MMVNDFIFKAEKRQPKTIYWKPKEDLKYPASKQSVTKWLIFFQSSIKIPPKEGKRISLGFGYIQSEGLIAISPAEELKLKLGVMKSIFLDQQTQDLQIYIFNFSQNILLIPENSPLCFVQYLKP